MKRRIVRRLHAGSTRLAWWVIDEQGLHAYPFTNHDTALFVARSAENLASYCAGDMEGGVS